MNKFLVTMVAVCAVAFAVQDMHRIYTAVYADGQFVKYARPALEFATFGWQVEHDNQNIPFVYAPAGEVVRITMEDMPFLRFLGWHGEPQPRFSGITSLQMEMPPHNITARANFEVLYRVLVDGVEHTFPANTQLTLPNPDPREGYEFIGWHSEIPIIGSVFTLSPGSEPGHMMGSIMSVWRALGGSAQPSPPTTTTPPQMPPEVPSPPSNDNHTNDNNNASYGNNAASLPTEPRNAAQVRVQAQPPHTDRVPRPSANTQRSMVLSEAQNPCPVAFLAVRGIMPSPAYNYFAPNQAINQSTFIYALMNAHHAMGGSVFSVRSSDSAGSWYGSAVDWAVGLGVLDNTNFNAYTPITPEEVAEILAQYLTIAGNVANGGVLPQGTTAPLTRAEASEMLINFFGL